MVTQPGRQRRLPVTLRLSLELALIAFMALKTNAEVRQPVCWMASRWERVEGVVVGSARPKLALSRRCSLQLPQAPSLPAQYNLSPFPGWAP